MGQLQAIVVGLVPSIGIGYLFYRIMRAILEGDRNERLAHARWEAEQDAIRDAETAHGAGAIAEQPTAGGAKGPGGPAN